MSPVRFQKTIENKSYNITRHNFQMSATDVGNLSGDHTG